MGRKAVPILLSEEDRHILEERRRVSASPRGAWRAGIILAAAAGLSNKDIAARVGCSLPTVSLWRRRFAERGLDGLRDEERPGRPAVYDVTKVEEIVASTLSPPVGWAHWSTRRLGRMLGVSHATVHRIWRRFNLEPHRTTTYQRGTVPGSASKVVHVVGLYLHPPDNAVVLTVDDRTRVDVPGPVGLRSGHGARDEWAYRRSSGGISAHRLFEAVNAAAGAVLGGSHPAYRRQSLIRFLRRLNREHPQGDLHLIVDRGPTYSDAEIQRWLERHSRFTLHHTSSSTSCILQVEKWIGILCDQALRREIPVGAETLVQRVETFITRWNAGTGPFVWVERPIGSAPAAAGQFQTGVAPIRKRLGKVMEKQDTETRHGELNVDI